MLALTAQSTLQELPVWDVRLDLSEKGALLGDILQRDPRLPGVVMTDGGQIKGTLSRGQYLRLVGRNLGLEVFHPRPLRLMFESAAQEDDPLVVRPSTPIQTALSRALQRPRELLYEPLIVGLKGDLESTRLVDFQDLLMADSRISVLRNAQMRQILSTVREGFLLVDQDHRIAAEYSASVETLFEAQQLADRRLPAVLGEFLGDIQAAHARAYLDALFDPNVVEKLVTKINPLSKPPDMDFLLRRIDRRVQQSRESILRGITLESFLQVLQVEQKTCTLTVVSRHRVGHLYIDKGELIHAETGSHRAKAAVFAMLSWNDYSIKITESCNAEPTITERLNGILMDWCVHKDHGLI